MKNNDVKVIPFLTEEHHKMEVSAVIYGTYCEDAMIYLEKDSMLLNTFFILQNRRDGSSCSEKCGYMYSWNVASGLQRELERNSCYITNRLKNGSADEILEAWEDYKLQYEMAMVESLPTRVNDYINKNDSSTLYLLDSYKKHCRTPITNLDKVDASSVLDGVTNISETDILVAKLISILRHKALSGVPTDDKEYAVDTRQGRRRSAFDLWRHAKAFDENIDILDVMYSVYKIATQNSGFRAFFCSTIKRIVIFPSGGVTSLMAFDEFGSKLETWSHIPKILKNKERE